MAGEGASMAVTMMSGAVSGTIEHLLPMPFDTIKTRMQSAGPSLRFADVWRETVGKGRIRELWRGAAPVMVGVGPSHALYFGVYQAARTYLARAARAGSAPNLPKFITDGASGVCATLVSDSVQAPTDMLKQRLQVSGSPYRGLADVVRRVLATEGPAAFMRSYTTTIAMNIPFHMVYTATYQMQIRWASRMLSSMGHDFPGDAVPLPLHFLAGGGAGGAAALFTNPLDVVKTRLQLQAVSEPAARYRAAPRRVLSPVTVAAHPFGSRLGSPGRAPHTAVPHTGHAVPLYSGLLPTARTLFRAHGASAFFAGMSARMLFHVPAAAISWSVYELSVRTLSRVGSGPDEPSAGM